MRVLYLSWGEVPRLSSVYGGQVVEVVSELQKHPAVKNAALMAGYPLIHSGIVREKWHYGKQLKSIRERLGAENFITRRIPVPPVGVHPKPWQLPFFTAGHHAKLANWIREHEVDVIQCRSYVGTHFALETRARYGLNVKVVFDARSLMPEEACVSGRWRHGSSAFQFWKRIERSILTAADASTAVSKPMQEHFDALGAKRTALIHLNARVEGLDEARIADTTRLDAGTPVIAYAGYLTENSWHDPLNLWRAFAAFRNHCPGARLLLITKSDHGMLRSNLRHHGMAELEEAITFTSAASPIETISLLQQADVSVLSYRTPVTKFDRDLAEPVFATKSAEYLAVGLPVLVNEYCGGVRDYAVLRNAGVAYHPETGPTADQVANLLRQARNRLQISRTARSDFSVTENAGRLVQMYEDLLTEKTQSSLYASLLSGARV